VLVSRERNLLVSQYEPEVRNDIQFIADQAKIFYGEDINIAFDLLSARTKTVEKIERKMHDGRCFGDLKDVLGGRIIVDTCDDVAKLMEIVEAYYSFADILSVNNKFAENNQQKVYRAVHYIIRINDDVCFELQIKTKRELFFGELEHDFVYKHHYKINEITKELITKDYWQMLMLEKERYYHLLSDEYKRGLIDNVYETYGFTDETGEEIRS